MSADSVWATAGAAQSIYRHGGPGRSDSRTRIVVTGKTFRLSECLDASKAVVDAAPLPSPTASQSTAAKAPALALRNVVNTGRSTVGVPASEPSPQPRQLDDAVQDEEGDWMDVDDPEELAYIANIVNELRGLQPPPPPSLQQTAPPPTGSTMSMWATSDTLDRNASLFSMGSSDEYRGFSLKSASRRTKPISASSSSSRRTTASPNTSSTDVAMSVDTVVPGSGQIKTKPARVGSAGSKWATNCSDDVHVVTSSHRSYNPVSNSSVPKAAPQKTSLAHGDHKPRAFVVVDTNVLISHLCYLGELLDKLRSVPAQLIIPWIRQPHIRARTTKAIHFIHDALQRGDPAVRGQKNSEHLQRFHVNDDTILDCAQYFSDMYKPCPVLLLSNDCNLRCSEGSPDQQIAYLHAHMPAVVKHQTASAIDDEDCAMEDSVA
ncbi:hypothetical protein THASP1DRAFT_26605 [Thamnocephalis sphaerospora]|uniref:PIN domain-containing protein n=1 Tax=Thamnocephalis sphaerospora TaxID=78915 RepID=A0A4P9XGR5_9FUNG|nr:hypothetical protein THASP1DRAFT_26605 [Thamnocephalis sphaerospora]|eukprot:RKP04817.1 hypothetical protein THASP1DRAFT_26605 [Thamnocephalis sphaerospora]